MAFVTVERANFSLILDRPLHRFGEALMRRMQVSVSAALAAIVLVSCVQASVRVRGTSTMPAAPGSDPRGTTAIVPNNLPRGEARTSEREVRPTACRVAGIPAGYVAVDYVTSRDCMKSGDSTQVYNTAVLLDVRSYAVGATVLMCADQGVPRGWIRRGPNADARQCPRDPSDKSKEPAVVEITRQE